MRTAITVLFLVLSSLLAGSRLSAETDTPYRITHVEGRVAVVPHGSSDPAPAVADFSLEPGDQVLTGDDGRIEIATQDGTVMELGQKSSLELEDSSPSVSRFFLQVGRLLARFSSERETGRAHQVRTPVAVAAVRGTELVLDVAESGSVEAGVIEGQVALQPASAAGLEQDASDWDEVLIGASEGATMEPDAAPRRLSEIPERLAPAIPRFAHIRQRVPHIRERWKSLDRPARQRLRQNALRERIKWKLPDRVRPAAPVPRRLERKKRLRPAPLRDRRPRRRR